MSKQQLEEMLATLLDIHRESFPRVDEKLAGYRAGLRRHLRKCWQDAQADIGDEKYNTFFEGQEAFHAGESLDRNPHERVAGGQSFRWECWRTGWFAAQRDENDFDAKTAETKAANEAAQPAYDAKLAHSIRNAVNSLPVGAMMTGNKVTIADDVSRILGETVTYGQIELAIKLNERAVKGENNE